MPPSSFMPALDGRRPARQTLDVIEIDEEIGGPVPAKRKLTATEVIEISSDDENDTALHSLRIQIKKLKEATSKLEDDLNCEICSMKMWHPFVLPQCGHTFCKKCLRDWFSTKMAQHQTVHPDYDAKSPIPIPHPLQEAVDHGRIIPAQLTALLLQIDIRGPVFTCPTCREAIRTRPIESFALRRLVQSVAGAQGEAEEIAGNATSTERGQRHATVEGDPWSRFFPA
ncbi:hypothetical protein BDZ89DRAFT_1042522 [Hymenopellis radicata]|nr:hypothetical protein BDZ89DRAFT_1042522 [Hymenopellis radicata]